ncbi:hypothetical protein GCM10022215_24230 [Nocardioides fonticola]|uniref:Uncharacterized protein n=1 Tax=Nocardioides fonticola TaxID=450363 RepID=A0ABP7XJS9_9ACTN
MSNFAPKRTDYDTGDRRWLRDPLKATYRTVTISGSLFTSDAAGLLIKSGTHIGLTTADNLGGPYNGLSEEVQTVTEGGSGLTSFTLTFSGQTTVAIAAAATAATVQSALEALSTIGAGNVVVTGSAGGPYTVKFIGGLANTNVAQMTATPTGGSGTVTIATTTAGGAAVNSPAGLGESVGHLVNDLLVKPGEKHLVAVINGGSQIDRRYLPANTHDVDAEADLTALTYIN